MEKCDTFRLVTVRNSKALNFTQTISTDFTQPNSINNFLANFIAFFASTHQTEKRYHEVRLGGGGGTFFLLIVYRTYIIYRVTS